MIMIDHGPNEYGYNILWRAFYEMDVASLFSKQGIILKQNHFHGQTECRTANSKNHHRERKRNSSLRMVLDVLACINAKTGLKADNPATDPAQSTRTLSVTMAITVHCFQFSAASENGCQLLLVELFEENIEKR